MKKIILIFMIAVTLELAFSSDENTSNKNVLILDSNSTIQEVRVNLSDYRIFLNGTSMISKKINAEQANQVLQENIAEFCAYGENPMLEEICSKIKISDVHTNLTLL